MDGTLNRKTCLTITIENPLKDIEFQCTEQYALKKKNKERMKNQIARSNTFICNRDNMYQYILTIIDRDDNAWKTRSGYLDVLTFLTLW